MTVKELIERLQKLNTPDMEVAVFHFGSVVGVDPADHYNEVIIRTDSEDGE